MKVEYLFSRNNKIGSKIISWASSHEKLNLDVYPSHVAVVLDGTWVIESTLFTGVRIVPYSKWIVFNEELYRIPCIQNHRPSVDILEKATKVWHKKYDWLGIMYFAICYLGVIFNGSKLPSENKWQNKNKYFCTEYVGQLSGIEYSMTSPAKLLCTMLEGIK